MRLLFLLTPRGLIFIFYAYPPLLYPCHWDERPGNAPWILCLGAGAGCSAVIHRDVSQKELRNRSHYRCCEAAPWHPRPDRMRGLDVPQVPFSQHCLLSSWVFLGCLSHPGQSVAPFGPCQFMMKLFPLTYVAFIKKSCSFSHLNSVCFHHELNCLHAGLKLSQWN